MRGIFLSSVSPYPPDPHFLNLPIVIYPIFICVASARVDAAGWTRAKAASMVGHDAQREGCGVRG